MRVAVLDATGVVLNVIEAAPDYAMPGFELVPVAEVAIGDVRDPETGEFTRPTPEPEPPAIPETISDRQFAQALALLGIITEAEALAFVRVGTPPAALATAIAAIPDASERFAVNMLVSGATVFERHHPATALLGLALGKTDEQLDAIWSLAEAL